MIETSVCSENYIHESCKAGKQTAFKNLWRGLKVCILQLELHRKHSYFCSSCPGDFCHITVNVLGSLLLGKSV